MPIGCFAIDADEWVTDHPDDLRQQLADTEHDVAEVYLNDAWAGGTYLRCLFRALPGIEIVQQHSLVRVGSRVLAGDPGGVGNVLGLQLEPAERIEGFHLRHRTHERPPERKRRKDAYYELLPDLEQLIPFERNDVT